jgi:integrase
MEEGQEVRGSTFRRCACRNPDSGKQYGQSCPRFRQKRHGIWGLRQELPPKTEDGKEVRRTFRRSGYESATDAQADLDKVRALLAIPQKGEDGEDDRARIGDLLEDVASKKLDIPPVEEVRRKLNGGIDLRSDMTVAEWLEVFLANKRKERRATTTNGYESHIRVHLIPHLGHRRLERLNVGHIQAMFDAIAEHNEVIREENAARREQIARCKPSTAGRPKRHEREQLEEERAKLAAMPPFRRPTQAATRQRIRATFRSALSDAVGKGLIADNAAAKKLHIGDGKRPKGVLWTPERVQRWQDTGEIPSPVMVWSPELTGRFLDAAADHPLYALFHLVAFRGLRRAEAVGANWSNVDLERGEFTIAKTIVQDRRTPVESDPKTDGSAATIGLDSVTVAVLHAHRVRQNALRSKWGDAWKNTGKVFTQEDGSWLQPDAVSDTFRQIVRASGLPPISFWDLRHVAATLMHAGGADLHTIKEVLRHATIQLTSDTYTSLLPNIDREAAERAARIVPRARQRELKPTGLTPGSPAILNLRAVEVFTTDEKALWEVSGPFPFSSPSTRMVGRVGLEPTTDGL